MTLNADEIHLWTINAESYSFEEIKAITASWLTAPERRRFQRLYFEEHKHQLLLARYLLRSVLSLYEPYAPEDWLFSYNDYGKPAIAPQLLGQMAVPLYFNLSHSQGKVALALAREPILGVDIECATKTRRVEKIAGRYFSKSEIDNLSDLNEWQLQRRFYDLWTLKEAYIKACGMGLAIPLDQFSYSFDSQQKIRIAFDSRRPDDPERWKFWQLQAHPDYALAVAVKPGSPLPIQITKLNEFKPGGKSLNKDLLVQRSSG